MCVYWGPKSRTLQQQSLKVDFGEVALVCFSLFDVYPSPSERGSHFLFPCSLKKNNSDHTSTKTKGLEIRRLVLCWWVTDDACWKCVIFPFTISGELKICQSKYKIMNWQIAKSWARLGDFIFTFQFHALEKEMATHSSVLAWRIPGMGEPGGRPSMGSHRVGPTEAT